MSEFQLTTGIIALSDADNWDEAKLEWSLAEVFYEDEPGTCLCGHFPINEICVLGNRSNGNTTVVGNVCVKKFLGLPSHLIFDAIRRVVANEQKALNGHAIDHAHGKGWINDWERRFYFDTMRKRKLSSRQMQKRIQINQKLLRHVVNQRLTSSDT